MCGVGMCSVGGGRGKGSAGSDRERHDQKNPQKVKKQHDSHQRKGKGSSLGSDEVRPDLEQATAKEAREQKGRDMRQGVADESFDEETRGSLPDDKHFDAPDLQRPMTADGAEYRTSRENRKLHSKATASDSEVAESLKQQEGENLHNSKEEKKKRRKGRSGHSNKVKSDNSNGEDSDKGSKLRRRKEGPEKIQKRADDNGRSMSGNYHGMQEGSSERESIRSHDSLNGNNTGFVSGSNGSQDKHKNGQRIPEARDSKRKDSLESYDRDITHDSTRQNEQKLAQKAKRFHRNQEMSDKSDSSNGGGSYTHHKAEHSVSERRQGDCFYCHCL